jgi:threonine dehydratase
MMPDSVGGLSTLSDYPPERLPEPPVLVSESPSIANSPVSGAIEPIIELDGQVRIPGVSSAMPKTSYAHLVELYSLILNANRTLDPFRKALRLDPNHPHLQDARDPLTMLDRSTMNPHLFYKREDQTATKAYKLRGAMAGMSRAMEMLKYRSFLAVSTGNHALGVLKAAELLRPDSIRIVVPENTGVLKLEKIAAKIVELNTLGIPSSLVKVGTTFDDARDWALAQEDGEYYIDPYSDPGVVAGQGTIGLELFRQVTPLLHQANYEELVVISPIGGGGLLAGTSVALTMASAWDARFRSVKVTFVGLQLKSMDVLHNTVYGDAIRVKQIASGNRMLFESLGVQTLGIDDAMMQAGMRMVYEDIGALVEGPSGATVQPALTIEALRPSEKRLVACILSGGNVSIPF